MLKIFFKDNFQKYRYKRACKCITETQDLIGQACFFLPFFKDSSQYQIILSSCPTYIFSILIIFFKVSRYEDYICLVKSSLSRISGILGITQQSLYVENEVQEILIKV